MNVEQQKAVDLLLAAGFLMSVKGKIKVHGSLNDNYQVPAQPNLSLLVSSPTALPATIVNTDWPSRFSQFILTAQVPRRAEASDGSVYNLNQFSDPACKVYRKMIEKDGIKEDVLVRSTMLYYKSASRFKKTISNYITEGFWRTDYLALLESAEAGNLQKHIEDEIHEPAQFTRNQIG